MTTTADPATIVAVDDDDGATDLYRTWLASSYTVRTANGGREALDVVDETTDVVLLDRQMPDLTGDTVLRTLRDRRYECRVVMLTGVEPDVDIVTLPFDDYLVKPVEYETLREVVDRQLQRVHYDELLDEYFTLARKKALLEARYDERVLRIERPYRRLETDLEALRPRADAVRDELLASDTPLVLGGTR